MLSKQESMTTLSPPHSDHVLIEIVSASIDTRGGKLQCNTFCVVCDVPPSTTASNATAEKKDGVLSLHKKSNNQILHQTKVIHDNNSPVWTINDDSLLLLELNKIEENSASTYSTGTKPTARGTPIKEQLHSLHGDETVKTNNDADNVNEVVTCNNDCKITSTKGDVLFLLFHSVHKTTNDFVNAKDPFSLLFSSAYTLLGSLVISKENLFKGNGTRIEHTLQQSNDDNAATMNTFDTVMQSLMYSPHNHEKTMINGCSLALRYRIAQPYEIKFMNEKNTTYHNTVSSAFSNMLFQSSDGKHANKNDTCRFFIKSKLKTTDTVAQNSFNMNSDTSTRHLDDLKFGSMRHIAHPNRILNVIDPKAIQVGANNLASNLLVSSSQKTPKLIKTKPYADPKDKKETAFLTSDQIEYQTLLPSKNWIEAGTGDMGTVYLEILRCHNLPNLDTGTLGDYTDAFCAIVFEDNLVRTDVIEDELSPRWFPWTQRAFAFPMKHRASPIYLGVFDKDVIGNHDPIGRIVINVSNFQDNTVYLLNYTLHSSPKHDDNRGTITVRLRVEWHNKNKNTYQMVRKPRRKIFLNVSNQVTFRLVKYLIRGEVDMDKPSIESMKYYKNELYTHMDNIIFLVDDALRIFLWRGRIQFSLPKPRFFAKEKNDDSEERLKFSLWFPINSMVLFQSVILVIESPRLVPGVFFCCIGFILFRFLMAKSRHPMPWKRCKSVTMMVNDCFIAKNTKGATIHEYDGYDFAQNEEKVNKARVERVLKLLSALNAFLSKSRSDFSQTDMDSYVSKTETKSNFKNKVVARLMGSSISKAHAMVKSICESFRFIHNLFTFSSPYYSLFLMGCCFAMGLFFILFPYEKILLWMCRLTAWIFLSPLMKAVDYLFIMQYYPPPDRATDQIEVRELNFDCLFDSPKYKKLAKKVKIAREEGLKLMKMREYRFGKFIEEVPFMDWSLNQNTPLPTSTARPLNDDNVNDTYLPKNKLKWQTLSGQDLVGEMIPHTHKEDSERKGKIL